jgi:hypothetical protein
MVTITNRRSVTVVKGNGMNGSNGHRGNVSHPGDTVCLLARLGPGQRSTAPVGGCDEEAEVRRRKLQCHDI